MVLAAALGAGCGSDDANTTAPTVAAPPPTHEQGSERPATGDGSGGVTLKTVGQFEQPLYVTQPRAGDDALFVVEQCGRIARVEPDGEAATFLDLGDLITCGGEQGLLSMAFAPDHQRSGKLYVDYTDRNGDTRVVEYTRSEDEPRVADPDSARELLLVDQPYTNHNGGLVLFGPDGDLYIGLGDGGSAGDPQRNGQDLSSLLGKILRIDPTPGGGRPYGIPADNPFVDREGARPEIWAYGLRNPWRFSFDAGKAPASLWIGDVGQSALEEIDGPLSHGGAGANLGWSAFEGTERLNEDQEAPDAIPPTLVYGRDRGCSVTGGYVVRDTDLRSLYGRYLYGDYCQGELRSFIPARRGGDARDDRPLGVDVPALSSFGEDAAGHIYATSLNGPVYRLAPDD